MAHNIVNIGSEAQLEPLLQSGKLVVIDFHAVWCNPCHMVAPMFESAAATYPPKDVTFCKVDVDKCQDIAARFNVNAMPTFLLIRNGNVLETVQGANWPKVVSAIEAHMQSVPTAGGGGGGSNSLSLGADKQGANAILQHLATAMKSENASEIATECEKAFKIVETIQPFGMGLLPILISRNFYHPDLLTKLFLWIQSRDGEVAQSDASAIVHTLHGHITSSLRFQSWNKAGSDNSIAELKTAYHNLMRCPEAQAILLPSTRFIPKFAKSGKDFELGSSLGAIFAPTTVSQRAIMQEIQLQKLQLFPCQTPGKIDKLKADESATFIQNNMEIALTENKTILRDMLKPASRQRTLQWMAETINKNVDYSKTMQKEENLANIIGLVNFANVCVELALPVVKGDFTKNIPDQYLWDDNALVAMGNERDDVERVAIIPKDEFPKVDEALSASYKPSVHLFFLAIRSLSVTYSALLTKIQTYGRQVHHPSVPDREKDFLAAMIEFNKAIITTKTGMKNMIVFMNSVARWLTSLLKPNMDGTLPDEVPLAWQMMPMQFLDDVIRATQVMTLLRVKVDPYDFTDIIGLMLAVMGNLSYMPKAHTHALFPELLVHLLHQPEFARTVQNHPYFSQKIVKNCINCYIVMEKCEYDRLSTRFYLSLVLKEVLKDRMLCAPAKDVYETDSEDNTLERFSSMVTAETNQSLDEALTALKEMHKIEEENNKQVPLGNEDYDGKGHHLKQTLELFGTSVEVFQVMTEQFPKGVQQKMVEQQIASMLTRSICKLAGPNSKELKLLDPLKYGFDPRKLVNSMVDCFLRFASSATYSRCVCESGMMMSDVHWALDNIINRPLVSEYMGAQLRVMQNKIREAEVELKDDDAIWDDAPDEYLCALLSYPLKDPMVLPTTGDDLTYVERESIEHQLLQEEVNPFNRQAMTLKELREFNDKPEIKEKIATLKAEMKAWVEEKRKSQGQ